MRRTFVFPRFYICSLSDSRGGDASFNSTRVLLGTVRIIFGFLIFFQCTDARAYIPVVTEKANGGLVDCSGSSI